ncbi:MAG: hypothetical protein M3404_06285, partial [Actinomycetota bacterium]|nr:hypothetical protein [Actinomycetota bacterium]
MPSPSDREPASGTGRARAPWGRISEAGRPRVVGPHGRLSLIWAIVTVATTMAGPLWLALWLAAASGLAGAQIARSRVDRPSREASAP